METGRDASGIRSLNRHTLEQIVAASPAALLVADANHPELPIVYANPAYERLTGFALADLVGRAWAARGRAAGDESFAPLAETDSAGGVIVTDWYANPQNPTERVKVTAAILDANLRADALRVTAAREVLQNGQWLAAPVTAATVQRLEEIILTRARDLRRAATAG